MEYVENQDDPNLQLQLLEAMNLSIQAFLNCIEVEEGSVFSLSGFKILANT